MTERQTFGLFVCACVFALATHIAIENIAMIENLLIAMGLLLASFIVLVALTMRFFRMDDDDHLSKPEDWGL